LPNIILGKPAIKELIQHEASAENLVAEISKILKDDAYAERIRQDLLQVKQQLGEGGGSKNMALLALEMLGVEKSTNLEPVDFNKLLDF
jgi:lipid-A-disaccharide synthase